jgi:hypothetical protein
MNQMQIGAELSRERASVCKQVDRSFGEIDRHEHVLDLERRGLRAFALDPTGDSRVPLSHRKRGRFHALSISATKRRRSSSLAKHSPFFACARLWIGQEMASESQAPPR